MARLAYRPTEVAELLGVSPDTVRALVRAGTLPAVRVGRRILVPAAGRPGWRATLATMRRRRRRANGEGSVYRVAGRRRPWAATVVVGWRADGRPIRRTRFASSRLEAETMLAEMRRTLAAGLALGPSPTLADWLAHWLDVVAPTVRASTLAIYRWSVQRLAELLGGLRLSELRASHVEQALGSLPASAHTLARHRAVLRSALGLAVRDRLIPDNAAALARLRRPTQRRQPPTTDEVRSLLAALAEHRLRPLVLTLAATGLRIGEALGLRWADVDLDAGRLTVRWQLVRAPAEHAAPWVLSEPKTPAARRTIHLAPTVAATLRAWRASQATELLALGRPRPAHDLVWTSRHGAPLSPSTVDWVLRAACRRAGIRPLSPHDLRRYAATVAASTGDLLAAQALLGHTTPRLTGERYAAATDAALARAAAAAEEVLG